MRITNQNRASSVSKRRDAKKVGGDNGGFQPTANEDVSDVNVAAPLSPMQPVTSLDSLISIQEVEQNNHRQTAVNTHHEMLSLLDDIKVGLLSGQISEEKVTKLTQLTKAAKDERGAIDDAGLYDVLDEVDLRAQVELAKMQKI